MCRTAKIVLRIKLEGLNEEDKCLISRLENLRKLGYNHHKEGVFDILQCEFCRKVMNFDLFLDEIDRLASIADAIGEISWRNRHI